MKSLIKGFEIEVAAEELETLRNFDEAVEQVREHLFPTALERLREQAADGSRTAAAQLLSRPTALVQCPLCQGCHPRQKAATC